jgi:Fe-S cluster assembly protein SufD
VIETKTENKQALQAYLDEFEAFSKRAPGADAPWIKQLRQEAFARFWELGFPTLRDEDWRFTSLVPLTSQNFRLATSAGMPVIAHSTIDSFTPDGASTRLVFVNGQYAPELSHVDTGAGVVVMPLGEAIAAAHPLVQQHLAKHEDYRADAFTALNTAFVESGAFVHVKRGAVIRRNLIR